MGDFKPSSFHAVAVFDLGKNLLFKSAQGHCTEVLFASFISGGFITAMVINPPERKPTKRTSVHCKGLVKILIEPNEMTLFRPMPKHFEPYGCIVTSILCSEVKFFNGMGREAKLCNQVPSLSLSRLRTLTLLKI